MNKYREGKVKSTPIRGVKQILKPNAYKQWEGSSSNRFAIWRALLSLAPDRAPKWGCYRAPRGRPDGRRLFGLATMTIVVIVDAGRTLSGWNQANPVLTELSGHACELHAAPMARPRGGGFA